MKNYFGKLNISMKIFLFFVYCRKKIIEFQFKLSKMSVMMYVKYFVLMNVMMISCTNKEYVTFIKKINDKKDVSYELTEKEHKEYLNVYGLIGEFIAKDSLSTNLSQKDWEAINKSFIDNEISKFANSNTDIGERVNTIEMPEKYILVTNKRKIIVEYNYELDDNVVLDVEKTKRFNNLLKTIDSVVHYKQDKNARLEKSKLLDSLFWKYITSE